MKDININKGVFIGDFMEIPLNANDISGFYANIRDQYFKIITSKEIPGNQKKEFYSLMGETIKCYRKSKDNIPKFKAFGDALVKSEESKLEIIKSYAKNNEIIQKEANNIRENQKSLDKNLKEIKEGVDYKIKLEEKSRDDLVNKKLGEN